MSSETRKRIASRGYRGVSTNRRISIASFGYHPLTSLEGVWKEVVYFTMHIRRLAEFNLMK